MDKYSRGLYRKFTVTRTDGKDAPGEKHEKCRYFVLDVEHDQFAGVALLAYAAACQQRYPQLATDIGSLLTGYNPFEVDETNGTPK